MEPRIIFLGTGGDSFVVGKQVRGSGGIIFRIEGYQFFIDPGPGALVAARHKYISIRETTAVFASHAHLNHSHDVNAIVSAMTYNGFDRKGVVVGSHSVMHGDDEHQLAPALSPFFKGCVERTITVREGQRVGIESIEMHALPTHHSDPHAVGFKFYTPEFVLSYSADTRYSKDVAKAYENSDILILNVVHSGNVKSKDHLTVEDAKKLISRVKPKLCVLTHFGNRFVEADPLYQAREIQKETKVQVIAAVDGLEINPLSYAARMSQKTLQRY